MDRDFVLFIIVFSNYLCGLFYYAQASDACLCCLDHHTSSPPNGFSAELALLNRASTGGGNVFRLVRHQHWPIFF